MCIKIITESSEIEYDANTPLEEQLAESNRIVIDYHPEDLSIDKFVGEVERICKNGVTCNLSIEVLTNNILRGAKVKKHAQALELDLKMNNLIKLMVMAQSHADKKLEEMSEMCLKR
jgi:hypothetical protein